MPAVASLVAKDLIRDARDEHSSFDTRRHPDPVLLRALSRYQRQLAAKVLRANRAALVLAQETALPLADFDAGIVLPDYKYPAGAEVEGPAPAVMAGNTPNRFRVELIPWQARTDYYLGAYIRNGTLYLTGLVSDWTGFTTFRFFYVPEVDALTALNAVLVLPNAAESALVTYLAAFMAKRARPTDQQLERPDPVFFCGLWQDAEQQFMDEMTGHTQAVVSTVRDVF